MGIGQLLTHLLVTRGYDSLTHTVTATVLTPTAYFGVSPSEGIPPLTTLRVEFANEETVELDLHTPERTVTLCRSILEAVRGEPDSDRYMYRVTNIHGGLEGATSPWTVGQGTPLLIVPAEAGAAVCPPC